MSIQEKWEQAAEAATSLKRIYPGSRADISSYLFLGQIYEKLNDYKKAIEVYERFYKEYPDHPLASNIKSKIERLRLRI